MNRLAQADPGLGSGTPSAGSCPTSAFLTRGQSRLCMTLPAEWKVGSVLMVERWRRHNQLCKSWFMRHRPLLSSLCKIAEGQRFQQQSKESGCLCSHPLPSFTQCIPPFPPTFLLSFFCFFKSNIFVFWKLTNIFQKYFQGLLWWQRFKILSFHCRGSGSIHCWGTKILQAA